MGLVKTRRLAAMQKQQRGNLRPMPKKGGDWKPQPKSLSDCKPVWNGKN